MPGYELIRDKNIESLADALVDELLEFFQGFYPKVVERVPNLEDQLMALVDKHVGQLGGFAKIAIGIFGKNSVQGLIEQVKGLEFVQDIAEDIAIEAAAGWVAGRASGDDICEVLVSLGLVRRVEAAAGVPFPVAESEPEPEPEPQTKAEYSYAAHEVATIDRAPMAMFEHDGLLMISCISRTLAKTPVWRLDPVTGGLVSFGKLPEHCESGHYGYSWGGGFHLTPESNGGCTDYEYCGGWNKVDHTGLCPHEYTNLKWGFAYRCPNSLRQFLGFGNAEHPGMLLEYRSGWQLFAAPGDMRFPTSVVVLNAGDVMVASNGGGQSKGHLLGGVSGQVLATKDFPGWVVLGAHHGEGYLVAGTDTSELWWARMENPTSWVSMGAVLGGKMGEPCIHPVSGRMIIPAWSGDKVELFEARREDQTLRLHQLQTINGIGEWAAKTASAGGNFYLGAGEHTGKAGDQTPGKIYQLTATLKEA